MQGNSRSLSILPMMILVAFLAFSVRLSSVFVGVQDLSRQGEVFAAAEAKPDLEAEHEEDAGADHGQDEGHDEVEAHQDDHGDDFDETDVVWRDAIEEDYGFENTKMDYLRDLEERRKALEAREGDLRAREALLDATQQEMERKYVELKQIRNQIEVLLKQQEDEEQAQIMSLVKIYEGMKAKEAAAIFNTLDIDILLRVTMNMSERKASAILAKMNPERAKTLTVMLAEQKSLPSLP
ncbi:MAG: flagellar protein FlbB [Alphaproteobacteria bacterium]|nr:flagellar protein FlbB [Alphaproteobacteria bacterium]HCQ71319.1 flagellar protein FlbB [Rhodospirillaceae bacterium]|tara:strand:- start:1715 stop:2428 length:714 start_codon:yes stop_codon:yes gene_type:complete